MQYSKYPIFISTEQDVFEFTSIGIQGNIEKVVLFEKTENEYIYNLVFGDKKYKVEGSNTITYIDDEVDSLNGDRDKVLATVAAIVYEYSSKYRSRWIIFQGSDERKTRLYRMAITKNYEELSKDYLIFGIVENDDEVSQQEFNSITKFSAYLIKRK